MKRVMVLMLAAALLAFCVGCGTSGRQAGDKVHVSVLDSGKLSVNGRITAKDGLVKKVKAAGARPATAIEVAIPTGAPQSMMVDITRQLRKAGYTRILFVRPREARISR